MRTTRVDVSVSHHQAYLTSGVMPQQGADLHDHFTGQANGICGAALPGEIVLMTAAHTGLEPFTISILDASPAVDDDWEDVVEVSFRPATTRVSLVGLMSDDSFDFKLDLRDHRVRYSVRGADAAWDGANGLDELPTLDAYALEFWPAPASPDAVLRRTSSFIAQQHRTWTASRQRSGPHAWAGDGPVPIGSLRRPTIGGQRDGNLQSAPAGSSKDTSDPGAPDLEDIQVVTSALGEISAASLEVLRQRAVQSGSAPHAESRRLADETLRRIVASQLPEPDGDPQP